MKLATLLILFFSFVTLNLKSQSTIGFDCDYDNEFPDLPEGSVFSGHGSAHTLQGEMHILIIFCGLEGDTLNMGNDWPIGEKPVWSDELFDTTSVTIGNSDNLSKYYYNLSQFSNDPFLVTTDIYSEFVEVPLTGSFSPNSYNSRVIDTVLKNNSAFNWYKYDNRTNGANFNHDNHQTAPDKNVDYIVFVWRDTEGGGRASSYVVGKEVYTDYLGYDDTLHLSYGHTHLQGAWDHEFKKLFVHEVGHVCWSARHYAGANSNIGNHFYSYNG